MLTNSDFKFGIFIAAGVFAAAAFGARTVYTLPDNSEVEISHSETTTNHTDSVFDIGENSVFRLTAAAAGTGLFDFKPVVHCTNGQARITVDATAAAQAGFTGIRWYNHVRAKGGITVKGLDKIVFGTASKVHGGTTDDNTYLDAVFSFVDAEGVPVAAPAGITVTNAAVLGVAQTCPLIPAANAWIWPYGANTYGPPGKTLDITGYNLGIITVNGIAADAIRVPAGSQLAARPCGTMYSNKGDAYFYKWGGEKQTVNKPVILDGGSFYIKSTPNYTHTGAITGNGSLLYEGGATAIGTFSSPGFTGAITNNGNRLVFGGSITAPVVINAGSATQVRTLAFEPANYLAGSTVTTGPVTGNSFDTSAVEVQVKQTLTLASVANRLAFTHAGCEAVAVVESVQSDAILAVEDGMELRILAQGNETKVVPRNTKGSGNWTISGPASGERVNVLLAQTPAGARLAFGGKIHVTGIPADVAEITILDGADVTGDLPDTCPVISLGGKWQYRDWHDKIALWCDATAADSFVYVHDLNSDAKLDANRIFKWYDCREERRTHNDYALVMGRFGRSETANIEKYPTLYPAVTNDTSLGGKQFVKSSLSQQTRLGILAADDALVGQRTADTAFGEIESVYAIVVTRNVSAKQGGAALCSREGALAASASGYNGTIFTNDNLVVYRDGICVDPTSTTWGNSEWHLYSFTTDGAKITGLCNSTNAGDSAGGGFDYAEIMIFDVMPTENERKAAEEYLAAKWGFDVSYNYDVESVVLSGYGETTLAKPTRLAGSFGGTLDLAGFTLELAAGEKPISADQIPAADRVLWIDPTFSGSVMMSDEPGKTDEVAAAFSRTAAGLDATAQHFLQSAYDPTGVTNRRPRLVTSRSGGVANKWFDFLDGYGDGLGNNLMICAMPWHEPFADYAFTGKGSPWYSITYRTIIMVIDSSRGGGSPFLHYAGGGDTGNRGTNPTVDTPIFNNCTETFTNANVYLNGVAVAPNPAQAGFSGKCEVYSTVLPDGGVGSVKAFAYCNSTYSILNQEKIGEILMYNTRLDDATRESIEAYLMRKWLGKVPEGYSDFSDLTVTGSGTLKVSSIADLPQLGAGFTGDVKIAASRLAFTFAEGATVANEAISAADTAFTLPSVVTVDISFAARPEAGRYTLFTADVANDVAWIKGALVNAKAKNVRIVWDAEAKTLYAEVRPSGTAIILR